MMTMMIGDDDDDDDDDSGDNNVQPPNKATGVWQFVLCLWCGLSSEVLIVC